MRYKRHYVYIFRNPSGVPVYVGRGQGARVFDHVTSARWLDEFPAVTIEITYLPDYESSRILEAKLIKEYGRKIDGGTLENIKRNYGAGHQEELKKLRESGHSYSQIAEKWGVTFFYVARLCQAAGLGGVRRPGGWHSHRRNTHVLTVHQI